MGFVLHDNEPSDHEGPEKAATYANQISRKRAKYAGGTRTCHIGAFWYNKLQSVVRWCKNL
jgi:hypothetical protein